jgi:hypothetical protein
MDKVQKKYQTLSQQYFDFVVDSGYVTVALGELLFEATNSQALHVRSELYNI